MKFKTKLKIAFCVLVIVPIMFILLVAGVGIYRLHSLYQSYEVEDHTYASFFNPMLVFNAYNGKIQDELSDKVENQPDILCNTEYLDGYVSELRDESSYVIVNVGGEYIYKGGKSDEEINLLHEELMQMGKMQQDMDGGVYLGGEFQLLVSFVDFVTSEDEAGCAYVITKIDHVTPQVKELFYSFVFALAVILICASGAMTAWIYRGMLTPIKKLKQATHNITEGNLDFSMESDRRDEIGELCDDFEAMRKRLKESAEEKIQNDRESKELISNISHDLKTPITAIKGYVEGIMDGIADTPEKMDRYIKTIYNKTMDMDRLINELTLYSKIDNNRIPYNFNKINVSDYFDDCVEEIKMELDSKNIELGFFNYTDRSTMIIADPEQLKRVVNNIISNSVKYIMAGRKGIINIRIKDMEDFVQVEIEDNGKGIAQKDIQYIFDRFYRTDSSRNSSQGGSGIGLSIVKKIIVDHGGQIWATSKEETGTIMYFVLRKYIEAPRR